MRVNRWPQGDFDLEPGDMVRIADAALRRSVYHGTWVWAAVAVADGGYPKTPELFCPARVPEAPL